MTPRPPRLAPALRTWEGWREVFCLLLFVGTTFSVALTDLAALALALLVLSRRSARGFPAPLPRWVMAPFVLLPVVVAGALLLTLGLRRGPVQRRESQQP